MTLLSQPPSIADAIAALYALAEVPPPSARRCIVPLHELVGCYNLSCHELISLSSHTVMHFLLQRGGLVEPLESVYDEPLAGFLYTNAHVGAIFVEQGDPLVRRRFSVAHELGHYLLHFRPLFMATGSTGRPVPLEVMDALPRAEPETEPDDLPLGRMTVTQTEGEPLAVPAYSQMEREANQFAAALLMPAPLIEALITQYADQFHGEDLVWRLSTDLLVSRAAMRWRLRTLGVFPSQETQWN